MKWPLQSVVVVGIGCYFVIEHRFLKMIDDRVNKKPINSNFLVGLGFNGPLRQYFSVYRAVSQREGERGEKG